jgi:hypothetical protein
MRQVLNYDVAQQLAAAVAEAELQQEELHPP